MQTRSSAEMPTSPPNEPDSSRIRSTSASSPGTISAVPIGHAASGDRRLLPSSRRCRRRAGSFRRTPACHRAAAASGRRARRAASARPWRCGRTPRSRRAAATRSPPDRCRSGARAARRSNRMVSCGSQARCAPRRRLQRDVELRGRPSAAVDFFRRRRGHREPRSLAGRDLDVEPIAAGDAAGSVDEHRRQAVASGEGKRTRSEPDSCRWRRRVTPST